MRIPDHVRHFNNIKNRIYHIRGKNPRTMIIMIALPRISKLLGRRGKKKSAGLELDKKKVHKERSLLTFTWHVFLCISLITELPLFSWLIFLIISLISFGKLLFNCCYYEYFSAPHLAKAWTFVACRSSCSATFLLQLSISCLSAAECSISPSSRFRRDLEEGSSIC